MLVYLSSKFLLDILLVEHAGEVHSVLVVFFPQIDFSGRKVPPLFIDGGQGAGFVIQCNHQSFYIQSVQNLH